MRYDPDAAVDRLLELLRKINKKMREENEKGSERCQTKIEVLSS